ncbi:TOBE domain-containing protein [Achromobacter animicus]|nr:TOBE domain-containing protein [Achromobacter animicus]MDH0682764.1 TOBE domain-containing protein [Achromobacter animicus]
MAAPQTLELSKGKTATALVKASPVISRVDVSAVQVSARNCVSGVVKSIMRGTVNSEVIAQATGGAEIASIITNSSVVRLDLSVGKAATVIFKASSHYRRRCLRPNWVSEKEKANCDFGRPRRTRAEGKTESDVWRY